MSRPSISRAPWHSSRSASAWSRLSGCPLLVGSPTVAVLAWADVPLGIQRQSAQRAGRPAGGNDPLGALDEGPRGVSADPHPQRVRALLDVGQRLDELFLVLGLLLGERLDHDELVLAVPGEPHAPDAEVLLDRDVQGRGVLQLLRRDGRHLTDAASSYLGEELLQPLGEDRD